MLPLVCTERSTPPVIIPLSQRRTRRSPTSDSRMAVAYQTSRSRRERTRSTSTLPSPSMTPRICTARQPTKRSTATWGPSCHWWWEPSGPGSQRTTTYALNLTSPGGCGTRPGGRCDSRPSRTRIAWPMISSTSSRWGNLREDDRLQDPPNVRMANHVCLPVDNTNNNPARRQTHPRIRDTLYINIHIYIYIVFKFSYGTLHHLFLLYYIESY